MLSQTHKKIVVYAQGEKTADYLYDNEGIELYYLSKELLIILNSYSLLLI